MMNFLNTILILGLVLLSLFIIILVLIQRTSGGLGSGLSSSAEVSFGGQGNNVLSRTTIYCTSIFFLLSFILYLTTIAQNHSTTKNLPNIPASSQSPISLTNLDDASGT